jgi:hypothetical protein
MPNNTGIHGYCLLKKERLPCGQPFFIYTRITWINTQGSAVV